MFEEKNQYHCVGQDQGHLPSCYTKAMRRGKPHGLPPGLRPDDDVIPNADGIGIARPRWMWESAHTRRTVRKPSVAVQRRKDRLVRIVGFILAFLIHGSATALAYYFLGYFLGIALGPILGPAVAKPLAIGLASLVFVGGAVLWYRIIVRGDLSLSRRWQAPSSTDSRAR